MAWMSRLYETYENNIGRESDVLLAPIAHMNKEAHIEVTLNAQGEFRGAIIVPKESESTLIPVSEASAGRTSRIVPHALCDYLSYIAGDFENYSHEKDKKNGPRKKYEIYISNLRNWVESEYSHPKIKAIYDYLIQEKLIADLYQAGIVELDEKNEFSNKKISGRNYEGLMVRFRILDSASDTDGTWQDPSLIQAYTSYYLSLISGSTSDICYFTGERKVISENHPKGILALNHDVDHNGKHNAKLISSKESLGFTYTGRFLSSQQAYTLSYDASQKIHNALIWLIHSQGVWMSKDRVFVCWNPNGKKTPDIFKGFDLDFDEDNEVDLKAYKRKLTKIFKGYQEQFDKKDTIIAMSMEAATPGRVSITYYNEMPALDFLDNTEYWGRTCRWFYRKYDEKGQLYLKIETPIFKRIIECAYGREREIKIENEIVKKIEVDEKILKTQTQRLIKCMLEKQPIPYDIVHALYFQASTPMSYASRKNRELVLSTACAMISKYYNKEERKDDNMVLDYQNNDRSYLFGRLLAIYEKIERVAFNKDESREPNAIRLQAAYVNHPMQTWKNLNELVIPYLQKLKPGSREYYRKMISEVLDLLQEEDIGKLNQSLRETYLLGYYLQRTELNKKKEDNKEESSNE